MYKRQDEHWEEAYIEKILKKVRMGEQKPLEEAIAEFTAQMAKTRMSLQNYQMCIRDRCLQWTTAYRELRIRYLSAQQSFLALRVERR